MDDATIPRAAQRRETVSLARALIQALKARGTSHVFGVPGGGSSLDLLDAIQAEGLGFVLTQSETAAAIMASVQAEMSGAPGAVLTGVGPGAAAVANGVAYASLERAPLVVMTDRVEDSTPGRHQKFDQLAMLAPLVKEGRALAARDGRGAIERLLDLALDPPAGPVHLDLMVSEAGTALRPGRAVAGPRPNGPDPADLDRGRMLLETSSKPVLLVGLEARAPKAAQAANEMAVRLGCPVLTTYKAKGTVPDRSPLMVGHFTHGIAEAELLEAADLIIGYGFDPVEAINRPWRYRAAYLEIAASPAHVQPVRPKARLIGPLDLTVERLDNSLAPRGWSSAEITSFRARMHARLATGQQGRRSAKAVIETARRLAPAGTRLAVDAGAHMLSTLAFWPADQACGVLKSNGLSTMGYALPAALAASLLEPERPVLAVTGDGGMMMCLAELATAVRLNANITVLVMNDAALSLIDIKQHRQGRAPLGVRYPRTGFAGIARGFGLPAWTVGEEHALGGALSEAMALDGPSLVDVAIDPAGYGDQLAALRG